MTTAEFTRIMEGAKCRVFGWEDAGNEPHRQALAEIVRTIDSPDTTVLCEPSLSRSTTRPPDIVVVCPYRGVAVVEVKGFDLDAITAIEPGGGFVLHYAGGARGRNPFHQVRNAMFDIKDAAQRMHGGQLAIPFHYFVALPRIRRSAWIAKWGEAAPIPKELVFQGELSRLSPALLQHGIKRLEAMSRETWPAADLESLKYAFGDTSVLFPVPEERSPRRTQEITLGAMFDEAAEAYKVLSDEQQRLSAQFWESGPRIVRGVAGSGKTIVLANNLARRIQRLHQRSSLFSESPAELKILVVCFNRTLVPFVEKKIGTAYLQRTGATLPKGVVDVMAFNSLMWHLAERGVWRYQKVFEKGKNDRDRVCQYQADLAYVKQNNLPTFESNAYDAIYCDEGQDFLEEEFQLLSQLLRCQQEDPSLFVFYDDAQNLYGRTRPNWHSLGLNVVGQRSHIMTECFRNTRQIVEVAFNVLYGSFAENKSKVPTRAFGDVSTLVEKGLLSEQEGYRQVRFARREAFGQLPRWLPMKWPKITWSGNGSVGYYRNRKSAHKTSSFSGSRKTESSVWRNFFVNLLSVACRRFIWHLRRKMTSSANATGSRFQQLHRPKDMTPTACCWFPLRSSRWMSIAGQRSMSLVPGLSNTSKSLPRANLPGCLRNFKRQ